MQDDIAAAEKEFDKLEWLHSGKPVPLVIGDVEFGLRQPSELERDRMDFARLSASDWALAQYRSEGLDKEPITDASRETQRIYLEALEVQYQAANDAGDGDGAREAAEMMERVRGNWPVNLADERSRDYGTIAVRRFVVDKLLVGNRKRFDELTRPDPLRHDAVSEAVDRLLSIINHDPNSSGRNSSDQS